MDPTTKTTISMERPNNIVAPTSPGGTGNDNSISSRKDKVIVHDNGVLRAIFAFLPLGTYRYTCLVNRQFQRIYLATHGDNNCLTSLPLAFQSIETAKICIHERPVQDDGGRQYCRWAIQVGPLDVLQYLVAPHGGGYVMNHHDFIRVAAKYGRLDILQWVLDYGNSGGSGGSFDVVRSWMRNNVELCNAAASAGNLAVLQCLHSNGCAWDASTCFSAAKNGHLEVLQWTRNNGCAWDAWTCASAAENGHLEVLQWARNNGCEARTCSYAAKNGHLEVLQWARNNGCAWDAWTCASAAENGHLEVLQWARNNGCEWDAQTCSLAARNGHWDIVQWAQQHGCRWNYQVVRHFARRSGNADMINWIIANRGWH